MHRSVSVVIPVRNEAEAIKHAIDSIRLQTYPNIIEIIVADGMSTDGTRQAATSSGDTRIRVIDNPSTTTPAALNRAIAAATAEIIVRCDAHSVFAPDYVERAVATMQATGAVNVGGIQRATGSTWIQSAVAMAMSSRIGVGDAKFHFGGSAGPTDTVYLGVFDAAALDEVGGFDETLIRNQDYELNVRLRQSGGIVYFDPNLEVRYYPRASLGALARQYFQYGSWKRVVHRQHPGDIRARQLAPPLLVLGLILSAALLAFKQFQASLILPVAYIGIVTIFAIVSGARTRSSAWIGMIAAVIIMHLSWGLGYLSGATPGQPNPS